MHSVQQPSVDDEWLLRIEKIKATTWNGGDSIPVSYRHLFLRDADNRLDASRVNNAHSSNSRILHPERGVKQASSPNQSARPHTKGGLVKGRVVKFAGS